MSKKDKPSDPEIGAEKPATKAKRKRRTLVRKTRYLALEPRIVFDGALAADIVDKTTQTPGDAAKTADSSTASDRTLPAVDWTQTSLPAATSVDGKSAPAAVAADKAAADKATEAANKAIDDRALPGGVGASGGRTELIFVDTSVSGYQALIQNISPSAQVVILDSTRDAVGQIARRWHSSSRGRSMQYT